MSARGPQPGAWRLKSASDPRFCAQGLALVGGLAMPAEARRAIVEKERELGVERPVDLDFSYEKF